MDTNRDKTKVYKWKCKGCKFENLKDAKVCKKCKNDKGATAEGHHSGESRHDVRGDKISPNLGGAQKKESHQSPPILADVNVIISRLENESKQLYEDAKSAIKSKHLKQITQSKQHINETLDEASRLLSKQTPDELSSSTNRKSQDTILKHKRKSLMADRETQWSANEKNLMEEFKVKRRQKLTEIEKGWTERWKREMEETWSAINSKDEEPEKENDIRKNEFVEKFTRDSLLKFDGMKIMWDIRNNMEWTAHRLIQKHQWDNESGEMWKVEKKNCMAKHADVVVSKADAGINADSKKIIEMLEMCKSQIENIFKLSKAMATIRENIQQTIEEHTSKDIEGCQELHSIMAAVSATMQRQEEDFKTLKNKKKEWQLQRQQLEEKQSEMNQLILQYEADLKKWQDKCETLTTAKRKLNRLIKEQYRELDEVNDQLEYHRKNPKEKSNSGKKAKDFTYGTDDSTFSPAEDFETSIHGSTSDITEKDDGNKRPIENCDEDPENSWKCQHCTCTNSHNTYICIVCSKSDAKQRERITSEKAEMEKQKHRPVELTENSSEVSEESDTDTSDG